MSQEEGLRKLARLHENQTPEERFVVPLRQERVSDRAFFFDVYWHKSGTITVCWAFWACS